MKTGMGSKAIIHLDMDAFYAAVEVVDNPSLKGKPVIVGGSKKRGVVSSASYEARKFGIHSAMPLITAYKLCPKAIFLPVDYREYSRVSKKIKSILREFSPQLNPVDDYLEVTLNNIGMLLHPAVSLFNA